MDMEEVYLRQITEYLKRQTELQEANNDLLKELLKKTGNQHTKTFYLTDVKAYERVPYDVR